MRHVVVVGAGVAGTAATMAAAEGGARVTLVHGGTGASVLAGGALDDVPWDEAALATPPEPLAERARAAIDLLGGYAVTGKRATVATLTGLVRPARGIDRALLDLARFERATLLVPDCPHGAWDAPSLARTWSASPLCRAAGVKLVAVAVSLHMRSEEHSFPDADMAACHDDPSRLSWLAVRLRDALDRAGRDVGGIVLPPWLGVTCERATALTLEVGVPCGEALGGVGGPSGLRFEHARDRALARAGVTVVLARATRVSHAERSGGDLTWRVDVDAGEPPLEADAVVLATGGILGGGLEYTTAGAYFGEALPTSPRPLLRTTCDAPVRLGAFGRRLDDASSLFGAAPETHAWPYVETPLLDHAGVLVHDGGEVRGAAPGLYATGELAAGPPHTWLAALVHGTRVGDAAARA